MPAPLDIVPVTPERWPALEEFAGPSGLYSHCWCVWWRRTSAEFDEGAREGGAGNRGVLERLTRDGEVPGLLAYEGERAVGWVSVAPRGQFGRVRRSPLVRPDADDPDDRGDATTWAVTCFWVPAGERGRGVARELLAGAVAYAVARGAEAVEGYPVDTDGAAPASSIFTGTLDQFRDAGFTEVRRRKGRPTVRLVPS